MKTAEIHRKSASLALCVFLLVPVAALAQDEDEEEKLGWSNVTDLSLVVTDGNSNVETLGFKNTFRNHWQQARYSLRLARVRNPTTPKPVALSHLISLSDKDLRELGDNPGVPQLVRKAAADLRASPARRQRR